MAKILPVLVDSEKYNINEDIKMMKKVLAVNELDRYTALDIASKLPLQSQNWYYIVIYRSGLFKVYDLFGVKEEDIEVVKNLFEYNYNPSYLAFETFLNSTIGKNNSIEITYEPAHVTLKIGNSSGALLVDVNYDVAELNLESYSNDDPESIAAESVDNAYVFANQRAYILENYLPLWTKLDIMITG